MKENSKLEEGFIKETDNITPSYVNTKNPKYIEIDRNVLFWNNACRL